MHCNMTKSVAGLPEIGVILAFEILEISFGPGNSCVGSLQFNRRTANIGCLSRAVKGAIHGVWRGVSL